MGGGGQGPQQPIGAAHITPGIGSGSGIGKHMGAAGIGAMQRPMQGASSTAFSSFAACLSNSKLHRMEPRMIDGRPGPCWQQEPLSH
jgi:hypothetical protein